MATLSDLYGHLKTLVEQWVYNKTQMNTRLDGGTEGNVTFAGKVDKESGKGLSSNDYTTTEKNKLAGIEAQANKITVDSALSSTSTNPLQNKAINTALSNKADSSSVPTKTSDLTNDGADGTNVFVANNDSRLSDARTPTSHNQATSTITNSTAFDHIKSGESTTLTLDTQAKINDAINTKLGTLMEADIVVVTDNKGTASASTMNKLYLEAKSGGASGDGYNIWITVRTGTSPNYSYAWEKVDDFDLQTLSVAWANVTGKPASSFGTTSGTFAEGDHKHSVEDVSDPNADDYTNIGDLPEWTSQARINYEINTTLGNKIDKSDTVGLVKNDGTIDTTTYLSSLPSHSHGNILNGGTITTDVAYKTSNNYGKLVITNTSNQVGTISAIDVWDEIVQQLIAYGAS